MQQALSPSPWQALGADAVAVSRVSCAWDSLPPPMPEWIESPDGHSLVRGCRKHKYPLVHNSVYDDDKIYCDDYRKRVHPSWGREYKDLVLMRGCRSNLKRKFKCGSTYDSEVGLARAVAVRYFRRYLSRMVLVPSPPKDGDISWSNPLIDLVNKADRILSARYWGHHSTWNAYFNIECIVREISGDCFLRPNVLILGNFYRIESKERLRELYEMAQLSENIDSIESRQ